MRRGAAGLVGLSLSVLLCSCVGATRTPMRGRVVEGLDRKLSAFAFIEEGDLLTLIVDTRAARLREESPYLPIEVAVANRDLRQLTLTRESFTLVDADGNRYPCAGPKELLEGYEFLDMDRRVAELDEIVFNRFVNFTRYQSQFSPTRSVRVGPGGSTIVKDRVVLPKFGYLLDMIYFPRPKSGVLNQKFELFVTAPELEEPVFVKFAVL